MSSHYNPAEAVADDDVIYSFISTLDWPVSRWVLEQHPDLLTGSTAVLLARMAVVCEGHGDVEKARLIDQHLQLLRRCREVGLDAAFSEVTGGPTIALSPEMIELINETAKVNANNVEDSYHDILTKARSIDTQLGHASLGTRQAVMSAVAHLRLLRYMTAEVPQELDAVIDSWETVLDTASGRISEMTSVFSNHAGLAYQLRYLESRDLGDLDRSIQALEQASKTAGNPAERQGNEANLRKALMLRYKATGDRADKRRAGK
jgi:hypothetical protein